MYQDVDLPANYVAGDFFIFALLESLKVIFVVPIDDSTRFQSPFARW
jgi:hypothetical protein